MGFIHGNAPVFFISTVICALLVTSSMAVVYKVGDSAGWTSTGNVDYDKWASSKTFRIGDIINFVYNKELHNVLQVHHVEYRSCNTTSGHAYYHSGNDSITITASGHYYFVCTRFGHCQAGQKVDIRIIPVPSVEPSPAPPVVAPPPSSASLPSIGLLSKLAMALATIATFAF